MRRILGGLLLAALLTGCSQVDALAPVGGNHLTEVRFAAIDVLMAAKVDILIAPVCRTEADDGVTCAGETLGGEVISAQSPATDQGSLTVTVGTAVLYSGSLQEVLDQAARATS